MTRSMKCYDLTWKQSPLKLGDRPLGVPWTPHHLDYKCYQIWAAQIWQWLGQTCGQHLWSASWILPKPKPLGVTRFFCLVKKSFQLVSVIECPFRIMAVQSTIMSRYYFGTKSAAHFDSNFEHIMNVYHVATALNRFKTKVSRVPTLSKTVPTSTLNLIFHYSPPSWNRSWVKTKRQKTENGQPNENA